MIKYIVDARLNYQILDLCCLEGVMFVLNYVRKN